MTDEMPNNSNSNSKSLGFAFVVWVPCSESPKRLSRIPPPNTMLRASRRMYNWMCYIELILILLPVTTHVSLV